MTNNELIQKSIKVLFLRGSGVVLLFLFTMFLTNYYSAELVGKYDFVRATIMILSGASLIGTNQSIIYYSGFLKSKSTWSLLKVHQTYFLPFLVSNFCINLWDLALVTFLVLTVKNIFNQ